MTKIIKHRASKPRLTKIDKIVSKNLKIRRISNGISQIGLANKLGITYQQYQKYEKGVNRISAGILYLLSKILDCSTDDFFKDANNLINSDTLVESRKILAFEEKFRNADKITQKIILKILE